MTTTDHAEEILRRHGIDMINAGPCLYAARDSARMALDAVIPNEPTEFREAIAGRVAALQVAIWCDHNIATQKKFTLYGAMAFGTRLAESSLADARDELFALAGESQRLDEIRQEYERARDERNQRRGA